MGMWAYKPWDNDSAADWYADLMDNTQLRTQWLSGINSNTSDQADVVRAAVGLFIMLGRVYIWPIEHYDTDLGLAVKQAECLLSVPEYQESPELIEIIKLEIQELKSRQASPPKGTVDNKKWWQFWK